MGRSSRQAFFSIAILGVFPLLISNLAVAQNTFPATGNVGIGTTAPNSELDIVRNGTGISIEPGDGAVIFGALGFNREANTGAIFSSNAYAYQFTHLGSTSNTNDYLALGIWAPNGANVSPNALTVNGLGNVGIGTVAPTALLHLWGNGTYSAGLRLQYSGSSNPWAVAQGTDSKLYFGYGTAGSELNRVVIDTIGNVGIGTTTPQYPLSVNGTIQAKEVLVNTGWADYVFQPGYRVRPLAEVATFIKANHRLPDIPSETEVRDKGIGLADMQTKLLAKIEELTLQMIQLDEKNKTLSKRVAQLEGR